MKASRGLLVRKQRSVPYGTSISNRPPALRRPPRGRQENLDDSRYPRGEPVSPFLERIGVPRELRHERLGRPFRPYLVLHWTAHVFCAQDFLLQKHRDITCHNKQVKLVSLLFTSRSFNIAKIHLGRHCSGRPLDRLVINFSDQLPETRFKQSIPQSMRFSRIQEVSQELSETDFLSTATAY